jgi:phosphate transport system permease protein
VAADVIGVGLSPGPSDVPRVITAPLSWADKAFRGALRACGVTVLVVMAMIFFFLLIRAWRALHLAGFRFLTEQNWLPGSNHFGIAAILPGGIFIALIALMVAVPISLATALFISEYAPAWLRRPLITMIDLMAAVPSIIYGIWAAAFLQGWIIAPIRFLATHLTWIPFFKVRTGDYASSYTSSTFIAGVVVGLMIVPITTALSREVFSRAPIGEREAAYALGSTKWDMVRTVVLPYSKGGFIGATMLGFGRAMGETITVALIVSPKFLFNFHVLEGSGISISSLIALRYGDSDALSLSALMAAGLVLFVITLIINSLAAVVISRSRSSAATS